jgi:hypothetical protein
MPGLPVTYFRVVHTEPDHKSGTVWEFGDFESLHLFVTLLYRCRVKSSRHVVVIQLRGVCGSDFFLMDKFFIDIDLLNLTPFDHPRRKAKIVELDI